MRNWCKMLHRECRVATFAVVDVETTGLHPGADRVVEVACVLYRNGLETDRFSTLVNPERPIPPIASTIHGIYDKDVADAPTLSAVADRLRSMTANAIIVGHNVRFDLSFLPFLGSRPSLCTLQLARRLIDAPDYCNETLRDLLTLDSGLSLGTAHRAECDALVTGALLIELLRRFAKRTGLTTVGAVLTVLERPIELERFSFGRHRNRPVSTLPSAYLEWIVKTGFDTWPDVRHTAIQELARRNAIAMTG